MIEYQLCHKQFRAITVSHLRWMHNMTTAKYKELYGEKLLTPPDVRSTRSERVCGSGNPNYGKKHPGLNKGRKMSCPPPMKGKTLEEYYGKERAKEIKEKQAKIKRGKKMNFSEETLILFREKCKEMNSMDRSGIGAKISASLMGKLKGDKNPNWRGGKNEYVGFDEIIKELVREGSHRRCVVCGKTEKENSRKLDVHHIDHNKQNGSYYNLIALCHSCHLKEGWGKIVITIELVDDTNGTSVSRTIIDRNPKEIIIPKYKEQEVVFEW